MDSRPDFTLPPKIMTRLPVEVRELIMDMQAYIRQLQGRVEELEARLEHLGHLQEEPHTRAVCALRAHPVFGRYVRQGRGGGLVLDRRKLGTEAKLEGKFLVSTNDGELSAEELARGYKELWRMERVHPDLKHTADIRPTYHRLDERIRAHVLLCWLALVLIRIVEQQTGQTWHQMRQTLSGLEVGHHHVEHGEVWQTTALSAEQRDILQRLDLEPPNRYMALSAG